MFKRMIFSTFGLVVLGMIFFGRDAASYVGTSFSRLKDSVKSAMPVEFEIDRARRMVKDLVPDIQRNMHVIAQEEVQLDQLQQQIAAADQKLSKDRTEVMRLKADASSAKDKFVYAGRTYTSEQVKGDLANRFERYKTSEATLASLRQVADARQKGLEAGRQKLEGMLAAKRQLEVDVENLEARNKMVEVAQTTSNYQFDDSQLGHAKELVTDLRTRLQVAEKMVNADINLHDEIPLDQPVPSNIVEQVTHYFNPDQAKESPTKVAQAEK
jgi:chromosome segregation ATPase